MELVFLGPPGAGKGTVAVKIAEIFKINHISTGRIFRSLIDSGSELSAKIKEITGSGGLIPDELTTQIVKEYLAKNKIDKDFILDGYPRTIKQAVDLETFANLHSVINFSISNEEIIKRLSGRRTCRACGRNFHVAFMPPKIENICDACGSELFIRDDDKKEAIENRLFVYKIQTEPLINLYEKKKLLINIDAAQDPDKVVKDTQEALNQILLAAQNR